MTKHPKNRHVFAAAVGGHAEVIVTQNIRDFPTDTTTAFVQNLSAVVDEALEIHVERLARQAALRDLLDTWDREAGPVPEVERAAARATFDELDGLAADRRSA